MVLSELCRLMLLGWAWEGTRGLGAHCCSLTWAATAPEFIIKSYHIMVGLEETLWPPSPASPFGASAWRICVHRVPDSMWPCQRGRNKATVMQRDGDKREARVTKLHGPFGAIGARNPNTGLAGGEGAEKKQRPKGLQGSFAAWDKQHSQCWVLSQSHGGGAASTALG